MSGRRWAILAAGVLAVAGIVISATIDAQRRGRRADEPALTVEEYTPRSTLVVDGHEVPRARFPVVDVHSHHWPGFTAARWDTIVDEMDALNLQVLVNLSGGSGRTLERGVATIAGSPHPGRMVFFARDRKSVV